MKKANMMTNMLIALAIGVLLIMVLMWVYKPLSEVIGQALGFAPIDHCSPDSEEVCMDKMVDEEVGDQKCIIDGNSKDACDANECKCKLG